MLKTQPIDGKSVVSFAGSSLALLSFIRIKSYLSFICYKQLDVLTCHYCPVLQLFERIKRIQLEKYHKSTDPTEKAAIEVDPLKIFHSAIENCKPLLQLNSVKRGGQRYQVK